MKMRNLGRSGLLVSELCLGTMIFGEDSPRSTTPEVARHMIDRYLETGGNHIDTADVYADGRSEEIVGEALKGRREGVVLATKVRFSTGDGPNDDGLSRGHILNGVEASLRRLQTDWIDLLYMHSWDPRTPLEESLRAFDDLVHAGKVRYIGVSNFKAWQLMKALGLSQAQSWARFVAAQYQYSLVVRDIELEFLDLCQAEGVGLVPWGPLGGGFLSGKYRPEQRPATASEGRLATTPDHDEEAWSRRNTPQNWETLQAVEKMCEAHPGTTHAQIALAWLLSRPGVTSVVLGARTPEQLEDNLQAANLALSPEELDLLDRASATEPGYPYRYLQLYGARY
jgi:aryl-alcohol dehydrogenase-like predicted oxidoreductase